MTRSRLLRSLCAASLAGVVAWSKLPREQPSCQYNIVSSTVVTAYCSHRVGEDEVLDLLIAWRGQPGWFQGHEGVTGGGGTREFGARTNGTVSQYAIYNGVRIAFDADFNAGTVSIGNLSVPLEGVNTILIDGVGLPDAQRKSTMLRIEPPLPLGVDVNLVLARRSRELRQFLRCDVPIPAPSPKQMPPQPRVVTLCEKLRAKRP